MKNFFVYLSLALLFLVVETTLLHFLLPSVLIPDIILIMVFYLGFNRPSMEGAFITFILGYLTDVFSAGIMGISSFTLVLIFSLTFMLSKIVVVNNMLIKIGGTMVMGIIKGFMTYLILRFLNQEIPFYIIFPIAISTGVVSPFIFTLLQWIDFSFIPYQGKDRIISP